MSVPEWVRDAHYAVVPVAGVKRTVAPRGPLSGNTVSGSNRIEVVF